MPEPGVHQRSEGVLRMINLRNAVAASALALSLTACMSTDGADMDASAGAQSSAGERTVTVGGAAMYPSRNIVENAANSRDHTTLVAAVTAAGLVETLSGPGPFTVFAPTNAAFAKLPAGTVETALRPENRAMLTSILTYHVVPGRMSAADLMAAVQAGGGTARLTTANGAPLTARMQGSDLVVVDARGGTSRVTQADVFQSNGVIHVTDSVSLPG